MRNKFLQALLIDHIKKAIVALSVILYGMMLAAAKKLQTIHVIQNLSTLTWLIISASLFLAILVLIASVLILHKKLSQKINKNDYKFIQRPGYYIHRSTGAKCCQPCLDQSNPVHSKLSEIGFGDLKCRNCGDTIKLVSPHL